MVDLDYVKAQLRSINFDPGRFNNAEIRELPNIILPDETIYECVNGFYEGGFALLVATDIRVLLVDKKPMGFLNVDDLRFDMISDIDYSHRVFGAQISIHCGARNLVFKSYNQQLLRKLIGHVQHRMAEIKKDQQDQASLQMQHLEDINKQLQVYLLAQQQQLEKQIADQSNQSMLKPNPQLADYLFAQRLLENFQKQINQSSTEPVSKETPEPAAQEADNVDYATTDQSVIDEITKEARKEIRQHSIQHPDTIKANTKAYELNPMNIAYSKLPYLLRTRRYRQSPFSS